MLNPLRKHSPSWVILFIVISLAILRLPATKTAFDAVIPVQAAPEMQIPIYTPTPGPDGRIIYIVKPNDTLLGISLITGVSVDQLRGLNNLTTDTIYEGQKLILGLGGPVEVTPTLGPTPTATPILPTPSPKPGKGDLCILLFNDLNGDSIRQEDEPSIPGGAISFGNHTGSVSENVASGVGLEPQCFVDLPEGDYTISVAVPEGYNPTTETSYELPLKAGDKTYLNFGAQVNSLTAAQAPIIPSPGSGRSPLLGVVGALFLLAGIGVAIFARRMLKPR
jgi:LysM repeat protein